MTEMAPYTATGTIGEVELRKYPELVLASVADPGDDSGFMHLFRFITGENRTKGRIPMTAPVISSGQVFLHAPAATGEKIAMTAPVVSAAGSIAFVMPAGRTGSDLPEPLDSRVRIITVPPREIAVLRFRGTAKRDAVNDAASRLLAALERAGVGIRGEVFLMRYNPPWMPGFLRRNEVAIELDR
jgi:hypothetical protein